MQSKKSGVRNAEKTVKCKKCRINSANYNLLSKQWGVKKVMGKKCWLRVESNKCKEKSEEWRVQFKFCNVKTEEEKSGSKMCRINSVKQMWGATIEQEKNLN